MVDIGIDRAVRQQGFVKLIGIAVIPVFSGFVDADFDRQPPPVQLRDDQTGQPQGLLRCVMAALLPAVVPLPLGLVDRADVPDRDAGLQIRLGHVGAIGRVLVIAFGTEVAA